MISACRMAKPMNLGKWRPVEGMLFYSVLAQSVQGVSESRAPHCPKSRESGILGRPEGSPKGLHMPYGKGCGGETPSCFLETQAKYP